MLGFTRSLIPEPENFSRPFLLSSAYNHRHRRLRSRYLNYQADMSSSTDSDDDLIDLITLPIIMYQYLNYMVEESCSTDDDTSYGSTVVSAPQKKRQKVSKGVGVAQNSSRRAVVSTQVKKTELLSQGVGVGDAASRNIAVSTRGKKKESTSSPNDVVATQEQKREFVLKGVGVHNSSRNAVVSTQEKLKDVSEGVGIADTSSHNAVVSAQGKKRLQVSEEAELKVSQQLDVLLDAVAKKSFKGIDKPGCSIGEVMQIVEGMPEIVEDDELFMKAADILTERQNREMFVALREKNRQIMWLKHKKV
ncbi:hypothetical protein AB3S75_015229 [Citrus x aurantiifolia]